jgi:hypothetical protein
VSTAREAAAGLVAYDSDVALRVLARIVEELDGPFLGDPPDVERARGFLGSPESRDADKGELSTREWKVGFARRERMRALGLELAKKL